jgi:sec-independent protein translocase protein TatC
MVDEKMPLTKHLEELRRCLIISLIATAVGFCIAYAFKERIFAFLAKPLIDVLPQGSTLQYLGLAEAFVTYLKIAFIAGIFLALPVILYEIWSFVAPGLHEHEKRYALPFVIFSTIFFFGGAVFCYYLVLPAAFKFFLAYSDSSVRAMPALKQYLTFISRMLFAFGVVFEMPLFFFFLGRIGLVSHTWLAKKRRYAVVLIFVAAAVLTPGPDAASQLLLAAPLLVLYEASVLIVRLTGKRPETGGPEEEAPQGDEKTTESSPPLAG